MSKSNLESKNSKLIKRKLSEMFNVYLPNSICFVSKDKILY
jgi:hypothetical protein